MSLVLLLHAVVSRPLQYASYLSGFILCQFEFLSGGRGLSILNIVCLFEDFFGRPTLYVSSF